MTEFDCDLFVIGGGSGGVRAARAAAQQGARVVLAEAAALGGTCVNAGCIPKKLYSYAAQFSRDFTDAAGFGWEVGTTRLNWDRLKVNRAAEISRLNAVYGHLLRTAGVHIERGWAKFAGPHTVDVESNEGSSRYACRHILIASGGTPTVAAFPGSDLVVTSDSMFDLAFPQRLVVVGGGYIACEFSSIFQGLGSHVTQLHRGDQVLRGFDNDVRHFVAHEMRKHGIDLRLRSGVRRVDRSKGALAVTLLDGEVLEADTVLYAAGRAPNTAGLCLEAAGVEQDEKGAIRVDAGYRTSKDSIHAIGDVCARVQLTPVALAEAMVLVDRLFGSGQRELAYELIPTAVFSHPNVATVGLTESEARALHVDIDVFRTEFRPLKNTLSGNTERTLMKVVVDKLSDRVVGLHMVGADAGEIVQGFAVAMKAGATKAIFDATIGIHPTAAEEFVTMREALASSAASWVAPPAA